MPATLTNLLLLLSSSGLNANFNKLNALALVLGVHDERCAQVRQHKNSDGADG